MRFCQVLGEKVSVTARKDDINIIGSDVSGSTNTDLSAAKNVNIASFEEIYTNRSQNKSFGWNAGVAVEFGQGMSFGFTGGANYGKGYENADSTTHRNSHVGSNTGKTTITAGETLNIQGGQVAGKGVAITAKDLNIESLQDTMTYNSKQHNISADMTIGYGFSGSVSGGMSKINADYASVNEQSGIFAGDDGYQINVKNHTDLKGGLITSTQKAEQNGKNRFETGTLTFADLANKAEYKGEAIGLGVSADINGGWNGKTVDSKGNATNSASSSMGYGKESDKQYAITHSGINTANITIRDNEKQQQITSKTAEETLKAVKTDITTDNYAEHSGSLNNNFDKDKVLKELNLQVEVTKDFTNNSKTAINDYVLPKQAELRERIKQAKTEEEKDALYAEIYKLQYQKRLLETLVGIVALDPSTAITQGTLQLAATKLREETLENSRKFPGIVDKDGNVLLSNVSYDSGYFDGVKLGGVRVDVQAICGERIERCTENPNGTYTFNKDPNRADGIATFNDAMNPEKNPVIKNMYGLTGGVQGLQGELASKKYDIGSLGDMAVESFAGTHDYLGGQMWGFYNDIGNTTENRRGDNKKDETISSKVTVVAIPVAAPFAIADLVDSDFIQAIMKISGH